MWFNTIAAVANDIEMLDVAMAQGASAANVISPYDGTALIAAAHLGHYLIVSRLIKANAPLDHINNPEWAALIEAVVLGDGGPDHLQTAKALLAAGADQTIGDGKGVPRQRNLDPYYRRRSRIRNCAMINNVSDPANTIVPIALTSGVMPRRIDEKM